MAEEAGRRVEVSVEEAVAIALDFLRRDRRENAEKLLGWILEISHGRYVHSRDYAARVLAKAGLAAYLRSSGWKRARP